MNLYSLQLNEEEMLMVKDYFVTEYIKSISEARRCSDKVKKMRLMDRKSSCARIVEEIDSQLVLIAL